MIPLKITTNIDQDPWSDCKITELGLIERIARIPNGCASGKAAVSILIRMADGSCYAGQTTLELLKSAIAAFEGAEHYDANH